MRAAHKWSTEEEREEQVKPMSLLGSHTRCAMLATAHHVQSPARGRTVKSPRLASSRASGGPWDCRDDHKDDNVGNEYEDKEELTPSRGGVGNLHTHGEPGSARERPAARAREMLEKTYGSEAAVPPCSGGGAAFWQGGEPCGGGGGRCWTAGGCGRMLQEPGLLGPGKEGGRLRRCPSPHWSGLVRTGVIIGARVHPSSGGGVRLSRAGGWGEGILAQRQRRRMAVSRHRALRGEQGVRG